MAVGKVRVRVDTPGQASQLLSILQTKYGILIIIPAPAPEMLASGASLTDEKSYPLKFVGQHEYRVTAHVSPKSNGNTIVRHQKTSDGRYLKQHSYYEPRDEDNLWPLFTSRSPRMNDKRYLLRSKKSDRVEFIGTYNPKNCTLIYSVYLSAPGAAPNVQRHLMSRKIEFEFFTVHIVYGYAWCPASDQSVYLSSRTAEREEGDRTKDLIINEGALSRSASELDGLIEFGLFSAAEFNAFSLCIQSGGDPNSLLYREFMEMCGTIRRYPAPLTFAKAILGDH
ncbi:hypothetical protein [Sphingomonas sp. BAUL-RG-20F-R05-02]|uniref:hypothetical protein n=1 Tax=Sphingomonas sp. BAUL-RG-20F-R05-02 TaxID=2914830 RepID=UPI001F5A0638|nr:hypothetical protein [Sphingomonas sp. BAUL-RG-20F-R05-02]